jgi:hypothetical protein
MSGAPVIASMSEGPTTHRGRGDTTGRASRTTSRTIV